MEEQNPRLTRGQRQQGGGGLANPLSDLRNEIDTLFDRFFTGPLLTPFGGFGQGQPLQQRWGGLMPRVDVSETDRDIQIAAELPGLKQEDLELTVEQDLLTIRGQTRQEREESDRQFHLSERSYGRFERSFRLPDTVDREKISARFENGLLTVTLPKSDKPGSAARRIEIGRS
jgi:HSP20 family protein